MPPFQSKLVSGAQLRSPSHSWWPLACAMVLLGVLRMLPLPNNSAIAGLPSPCGWYHLTGQLCPLCGLTRSLVCVAHGHFYEAIWWHPLGPALLLSVLAATAWASIKVLWPGRVQRMAPSFGKHLGIAGLALMLILWIARLSHWIPSPF